MRHVVWDWNGTLFADQELVLESINDVLRDNGLEPVDLATFQQHNIRPVRMAYERLFGRPITDHEWLRADEIFHDTYRAGLATCGLTRDTQAALDAVASSGRTQSLLSMWRHRELVPFVGTRCILYNGGAHPRAELERTGVPVADSLLDALNAAGLFS